MVKKEDFKRRICISNFQYKEDSNSYEGLVATTHPDRVGDILSVKALEQIAGHINNSNSVGDQHGSYRSVSLSHDWIKERNPELDEAAFLLPTAKVVSLPDEHYGVKVQMKLNEYYKGDISPEEIKFRVDHGHYGGLSIEYDTDDNHSRTVSKDGAAYRFIDELTEFGGQALARSRLIANPHAVIYKEIEKMAEEENKTPVDTPEEVPKETPKENEPANEPAKEEAPAAETPKEDLEQKETKSKSDKVPTLSVKELFESKEFRSAVEKELKVEKKILKEKETKMSEIPLSIKEMNKAISGKEVDYFKYKEAASQYFAETPAIEAALETTGIPLRTTLQVKCDGKGLRIVGNLQTKDTLDTSTNSTTYTQNIAEFADVFVPGLVDTFNNQTNLFGQLNKIDNIGGSDKYGWRIITSQQSSLAVDPDDTSIDKKAVKKLKLQTPIKEYRLGVSVTDYVLYHSRASMGDLFRIEVEKTMRDVMKDINVDLFTEQADGDGNEILGLEAVADSAGNTTLYGLTRSTANRLAPDAAGDTYTAVGGALTTAYMRLASRKVEVEGAMRGNIRYIMNPTQRDALFELEDGNIRYGGSTSASSASPTLGFSGTFSYDGIPCIVDSDCQTDAVFATDMESYYIVISRAPQVIGLAKVGAAEEAYVSVYLALVYEQPRRIHMLNTLS